MTGSIKGITLNESHIGRQIKVTRDEGTSNYLPLGFVATITEVNPENIRVTDIEDFICLDYLELNDYNFVWIDLEPTKAFSVSERKKAAKAIYNAKEALDLAITEARSGGILVSISRIELEISYQAKKEIY
jgi:hypothetical protein